LPDETRWSNDSLERRLLDGARAGAEGSGMAIRFAIADDQEAALAFGYSPLLETVLSLHVLVGPKHHALQHEWVRAMRGLRPGLRREIAVLSFLYRWTLPNCVLPSATTAYEDFESELARLRSLRVDIAAFELLRTLYDHGGLRRPSPQRVLADADVRATVLKRASTLGAGARGAAALLFNDPRAFVERFARLLETYWEEAFAAEWQRHESKLADSVVTAGREIASDGVFAFLIGLAPTLRVDPVASSCGIDVPHDHEVALSSQNPLLLVPSVYVWPHVRINCDAPWPLCLVYRAPHLGESLRHASPPELVRVFRALADPARLRILQRIAERPRSTQELAPLIGLSDAGTSKHLRLLAGAGILETRREGYYVVYSLVRERLDSLPADLRRILAV
jgi:DNA-binding transcriptional ArsR family regulator